MDEKSTRWRAGAIAWVVSIVLLPVQVIVAWQWPDTYSLTDNAISDLGVAGCGVVSDAQAAARSVCSPWHPLFNAAVVICGALTTIGAVLLYRYWSGRSGRGGMVLVAVSGAFVVVVGLAPWDVSPDLHDAAALAQAIAQWAGMLALAKAAGSGLFRGVALATVVVSVVGFVVFVLTLDGTSVTELPLGIAERLAFDSLTLWTAGAGIAVLANLSWSARRPHRA